MLITREDYDHKHAHLTNFPVRAKAIRISGQRVTIAPVHHRCGNHGLNHHGGGNHGHNHYGGDNHGHNHHDSDNHDHN